MICTFEATLSLSIERMTILVTGGAGFIGSHLIRHLVKSYPDYNLINLDALTYAADLSRLDDINKMPQIISLWRETSMTHLCLTVCFLRINLKPLFILQRSHMLIDQLKGHCLLQKPISLAR
jgi:hypothetical protein